MKYRLLAIAALVVAGAVYGQASSIYGRGGTLEGRVGRLWPRAAPVVAGSSWGGYGGGTNDLTFSQQLDNAAWLKTTSAGVITVTADGCDVAAPDGTSTAERVQFPSTLAAGFAVIYQNPALAGTTKSAGVYIRGYSGASGNLSLMIYRMAGYVCVTCTYTGTWSRCKQENQGPLLTDFVQIGNDGSDCGTGAELAKDVCLWQVDQQTGATLGPPVRTP